MLLQDSKQRKGEVDDSNAKRLCQTPHEKEKDILQVYIISHSVDNWQLHWKWAPFFFFLGDQKKNGKRQSIEKCCYSHCWVKRKMRSICIARFLLKFKIAASAIVENEIAKFWQQWILLICTNYSHQQVSLQSRQPDILVNLMWQPTSKVNSTRSLL